jgi:uncharacterized protein YegJ (DUF2314 family)
MRLLPQSALSFALLLGCGNIVLAKELSVTERAKQDEIAMVDKNNADMTKAIGNAKATLPGFLKLMKKPRRSISAAAVKIGVHDKEQTEFFWITPFAKTSRGYVGIIDNEPRLVTTVKLHGKITFAESEIIDWMYVEDGRMYGNYTTCALLKNESAAERETFKAEFGLDCNLY